jgi:hypothetical protein
VKRVVILATVILVALASVSAATAASDPRVPALQRKVSALQAQVNSLRDVVNNNATALVKVANTETCDWAYQGYFNIAVVNLFSAMLNQPGYSGAYPNDQGACAAIGRQPPHAYRTKKFTPFDTLQFQLSLLAGKE